MCSTFRYKKCMGRNFDYEVSYDEELRTVEKDEFENKYAILGMVTGFIKDYPLFYDAMNEKGVCISALAFEGSAVYNDPDENMINIPSYEFPLRIAGGFDCVADIKDYLENVNITNESYSEDLKSSALHWFICDEKESIVVESVSDGLKVHENAGDVMTNNPYYPDQLRLCAKNIESIGKYPSELEKYPTRGKETFGIPGDYTSNGRFTRLTYIKGKLEESDNSFNDVVQSFHLLSSVEQIYGLTNVSDKFEYTIYSIVYDMDELKVYLKRYDENVVEEASLK